MSVQNKNQNYIRLMETARELFWKHGFRRVTIQEICRKAGVSKMTFYKFFDNKIEMAKQVYLNEVEQGLEKFNRLIEEEIPVQEKLEKLMLLKAEGTEQISIEFMQDFYMGTEPELKKFVEDTTHEAWVGLLGNWKKAQEKGIFRNDLKPEFLLRVAFNMVELMKDENLAKEYLSPQDFVLEITRFMLYGISARK